MARTEFYIVDIALELGRQNLLPAIVFRTSRNQCDVDVQQSGASGALSLSPVQQRELHQAIRQIIKKYEMDEDLIVTHPQYQTLITAAVGAHHAGQLLMWRLLLEELMAAGYLRLLIATGTVAAGVDFPARTVVVTAHSRRGAEGFASLTAAELQQMSGRAGRRGKDTVGFCLVAPAPFCDARTVLRISKRPPEPLRSSYFPGPSTVLNLLRYRNVDDLRYTVRRSLAAFVDRREATLMKGQAEELLNQRQAKGEKGNKVIEKRSRRLMRNATELEERQGEQLESVLGGLASLGYLDGLQLSEKGYWASNLCTNLVLELGEIIESGLFDGASAEKLVAIVAAISGDEHRQYLEQGTNPLAKEEEGKLREILKRVSSTKMPGVNELRAVLPNAANTVLFWMHTEDWQKFRGLLTLAGAAEGDAARLITQTAEQLNQLTRLAQTHPQLVFRAEEAKRRILRPPLTEGLNLESLE